MISVNSCFLQPTRKSNEAEYISRRKMKKKGGEEEEEEEEEKTFGWEETMGFVDDLHEVGSTPRTITRSGGEGSFCCTQRLRAKADLEEAGL